MTKLAFIFSPACMFMYMCTLPKICHISILLPSLLASIAINQNSRYNTNPGLQALAVWCVNGELCDSVDVRVPPLRQPPHQQHQSHGAGHSLPHWATHQGQLEANVHLQSWHEVCVCVCVCKCMVSVCVCGRRKYRFDIHVSYCAQTLTVLNLLWLSLLGHL